MKTVEQSPYILYNVSCQCGICEMCKRAVRKESCVLRCALNKHITQEMCGKNAEK